MQLDSTKTPVKSEPSNTDRVDAVITWVNGQDPTHLRKREVYEREGSDQRTDELPTSHFPTRFVDNGELIYCLRSIRTFAPWIDTIYLVTDNQCPAFLTEDVRKEMNIRLVDHREIFRGHEWALPTFNSRTIETALWRIKGLAPKFIYFNDDFLLTRPMEKSSFFTEKGVVLRGQWLRLSRFGSTRLKLNEWASHFVYRVFGITRSLHHLLQIRSAQMVGFKRRYYRAPHVPHPLLRETQESFFATRPDAFTENIRYRFRSFRQYSSIFLANHLEIKKENAVLIRPKGHLMINGEVDLAASVRRKLNQVEQGDVAFLVLQGVERFRESVRDELYRRLNARLAAFDSSHPVSMPNRDH